MNTLHEYLSVNVYQRKGYEQKLSSVFQNIHRCLGNHQ